jgi:hypothetical protein
MELRLSGKEGFKIKTFSAYGKNIRNKGKCVIINLGKFKINIYPVDDNQLRELGSKLIEIADTQYQF